MGTNVTYGSIAVGAYYAHLRGTHQPAFTDWYYPRWDRGRARGPFTWKDPNNWQSLWSFGCRISGSGGGTDGDPVVMQFGHGYEPFSCDGAGCQFKNRIVGQCLDSVDAPVANAIVQGFVTATDAFVGEVTAAADGTYNLMTEQLTSTAHYLVAYKAGTPDVAGTTVNTLLPTAT